MWTITAKDYEACPVRDLEHLNQMLDELQSSHDEASPVLVQIAAPTGEVLMVGLAGDLVVLDHVAPGGWPAKHSVGNPAAIGIIPYMMGSHYSEMPKSYAIPCRLGRRAIEQFYCDGKLAEEVRWEED
jgi:hypothetical protein